MIFTKNLQQNNVHLKFGAHWYLKYYGYEEELEFLTTFSPMISDICRDF